MTDENNQRKFQYLKRGASQKRTRQRSVAINPPQPADLTSSSSDPSLSLINGLSPIPKDQPVATNIIRPTTAETGDSGVRDINLNISPTYDSASVLTTVTTFHPKSPPKVLAENERNILQRNEYAQNPRQLDRHSSHTGSYTSLDRIKTPPIGGTQRQAHEPSNRSASKTPPIGRQRKSAESDKSSSDFSVEIDAASRSKDSASVGTSRGGVYDASLEVEHDATFRPLNDSFNSQLYGLSHPHNLSLPPAQSQEYDQETPLNSRPRQPLLKSHSSGAIQHPQYGPYHGQQQIGHRFGIHPVPNYDLPPRPRTLESPVVVANGLQTPQTNATKNCLFLQTPILPEKFVSKEEGRIVESLAEQLRALLILIDVGMHKRKQRVNKVKYVYAEKSNALLQKEQEMKAKMKEEEQKLMNAKAKLKLDSDKMKQAEVDKKKIENDLKEVKTKYGDTARTLSDTRQAKNKLEEKLKKTEQELEKEKEKARKWETLNIKLQKDLEKERMKAEFSAKQNDQQTSAPQTKEQQQPRQPLRTLPPQKQTQPQQFHPQVNEQQPQQSTERRFTNTSTSSVESSSSKHVRFAEDEENHHELPLANQILNFTSLRNLIPRDSQLLHKVDDQSFIEEQYRGMGIYRFTKDCKCESIHFDNNNLWYRCLKDVKVNISYDDEAGHLTVGLPGGFIINTFATMQLEILRTATKENSVVTNDGTRYEYFNVQDKESQAFEIIHKTAGERRAANGNVESLQNLNTRRSDNDYVTQTENDILFTCPGFFVSRALGEAYGGGVTICVLSNDPSKKWKITICPEHQVFYIKHYNNGIPTRCFYTDRRCDHLKN